MDGNVIFVSGTVVFPIMASIGIYNFLVERREEARKTFKFQYNHNQTLELIAKNLRWTVRIDKSEITIKCTTGSTGTMWSVDAKLTLIFKPPQEDQNNQMEIFNEHFDYSKEVKHSFVLPMSFRDPSLYFNGDIFVKVKRINRLRDYAHHGYIEKLSLNNNVILVIEGKHLLVNSEYLSVHSPVFEEMFTPDTNNKQENEFAIGGIQLVHFLNFLRAFYFRLLPALDQLSITKVLELADRFEVQHVIDVCERNLIQAVLAGEISSSISLLRLADRYDMSALQSLVATKVAGSDTFSLDTLRSNSTYKLLSNESKLAVTQLLES